RDDALFAQALNNMALGSITQDDISIFRGRLFPSLPLDIANDRDSCIFKLFSTNDAVNSCNADILAQIAGEYFQSDCHDQVVGKGRSAAAKLSFLKSMQNADLPAHETMGLHLSLTLKVGGRYMITNSLDTSDGLINGTTGTLKKIDYGHYRILSSSEPIKLTIRVWLLLDDAYCGKKKRAEVANSSSSTSTISAAWTPIDPVILVVKRRLNSSLSIKRTQFPLTVAEAVTIHKSQGSSYNRVCIHLNGRSLSRSLMYVACSRAITASGLYLIGDKFEPTKPPRTNDDITSELNRQKTVQLETTFNRFTARNNGFRYQLAFHNVRSLKAHIDQVINDKSYLTPDFLLFAETWATEQQSFVIPGFEEASRTNVGSSAPRANGTICFINSQNVDSQLLTNVYQRIATDSNSHKMSISAFVYNDLLVASVYRSTRFSLDRCLVELKDLLKLQSSHTIIAGEFNSDFDDDQNSLTDTFSRYGLKSCLDDNIKSTTKYGSFIDNIFTDIADCTASRYISLTSYHDPLFMQFNL
ncbi:ATP-dependent DNA helicase PIF1, partial [Choanephora cucurbitarum]